MDLLVTGGAGYVGSHVVQHLLARGDRVTIVDRRPPPPAVAGAESVIGDLADRRLLDRIFANGQVDAVLHFAADKSVSSSLERPGTYFANNVGASTRLLEAMEAAGVQRLVFSSSCAVYGMPTVLPITESAPVRPLTPYGASKAMVEEMLRWMEDVGLRSVSLRYFNAAGAALDASNGETWDEAENLLPVAMRAAFGAGPPLRIFGNDFPTPDGTAVRDYVHVDDLARAHLAAVDHLAATGQSLILNLGRGAGASVLEIVGAIAEVGGRPVPTEPAPRRAGDAAEVYADASMARSLLGWHPQLGLDEIVGSAWRWYERQQRRAG